MALNDSSTPADARQEDAAPMVAASSPPSSGDGSLGSTDTAAGSESDVSETDTAAGGAGGTDTQAPLPPVNTSSVPPETTPG